MLKPGLLGKLTRHHDQLEAANNEEWLLWKNQLKLYWQRIKGGDKTSDIFLLYAIDNPIKKFVSDCYENDDVYGVFKDVKLCHEFGRNIKSLWICNILMSDRKQNVNGKYVFLFN
jgi:hypothetical protein